MSGCISTLAPYNPGKKRSDEIDRFLEEDAKRLKHECKILVFGSGGSGKSTIMKQLRIMHGGFSETELAQYRQTIHRTILDSAKRALEYMSREGLECVESSNRTLAEKILDYSFEPQNIVLSTEIAESIHQIVNDPIFSRAMNEHSGNFYLEDSASYFLMEISRIGASGYLPNTTDVMKTKMENIPQTFNMGPLLIRMLEISQRSGRRKWIHYYESVTTIMFCTALSEYDQGLLKDGSNNLLSSLVLFEALLNSRWCRLSYPRFPSSAISPNIPVGMT